MLTTNELQERLSEAKLAVAAATNEKDYDRLQALAVGIERQLAVTRAQELQNAQEAERKQREMTLRHIESADAGIAARREALPALHSAALAHLVNYYQAIDNLVAAQYDLAYEVDHRNTMADRVPAPRTEQDFFNLLGLTNFSPANKIFDLKASVYGMMDRINRRMLYIHGVLLVQRVRGWKVPDITYEMFTRCFRDGGIQEVDLNEAGELTN